MSLDIADLFLAKYQKDGRGPARYDCFGLFREIAARRGVVVPEHSTPCLMRDREAAILAAIDDEGWQPLPAPEPWCGVALRIGPWVAHLGTLLDDGARFIHITSGCGVTTARLDDPRWSGRIVGFYRWGGSA